MQHHDEKMMSHSMRYFINELTSIRVFRAPYIRKYSPVCSNLLTHDMKIVENEIYQISLTIMIFLE